MGIHLALRYTTQFWIWNKLQKCIKQPLHCHYTGEKYVGGVTSFGEPFMSVNWYMVFKRFLKEFCPGSWYVLLCTENEEISTKGFDGKIWLKNIWPLQVCTMFNVQCTVINADRYKKILMWSIPIVELIGSGFKKRTDDEIEPLLRKILRKMISQDLGKKILKILLQWRPERSTVATKNY